MTGRLKTIRRRFHVGGQVQGVGFRPYVYRLAVVMRLGGFVSNDPRGVIIEVQGPEASVDDFASRLRNELPPLARISRFEQSDVDAADGDGEFQIRPNLGGELADAQITVETAVCDDCLREMNDPGDPRFGYAFINCTNCGPRYSIITRIPYDRANTTMSDFAMCPPCAGEYSDPASRRFHAQPIACPSCGPKVWLVDSHGVRIDCDDPIARAAEMLVAGKIVAIKGLGGFHLACRADDDHAVRRLRRLKARDAKPFAIMVADVDQAASLCDVSPGDVGLLAGAIRPIILLPRKAGAKIAPDVAGQLDTLGAMLPYTPLHHLIFAACARANDGESPPLIMTSGNISDEPLVKDNDAAVAHLGHMADAMLLHDRRIERRLDDSVVQASRDGSTHVLRRARGYAPQSAILNIGGNAPDVLAVGAELKNTICLYSAGRCLMSEHIGDLKDARVYRHFIDTINHLEKLYCVRPQTIACDLHPQYLSSEYAAKRCRGGLAGAAESFDAKKLCLITVQHHHAHIVSCMAENDFTDPVIGLACDGVGYGDDGAVWGCEVLLSELHQYRRLGHLRYTPLPGGDAAAKETYRPAMGVLWDAFGPGATDEAATCGIDANHGKAVMEMIATGTNCPPSSSLGRWFDAVACLSGLAGENQFEAQAPMLLEAAIDRSVTGAYEFDIIDGEPFQIDLRPAVRAIVRDVQAKATPGRIAAGFHNAVVEFLCASAERAAKQTGLKTVALSGGCFANRFLTESLSRRLAECGFRVLRHGMIPSNDGGVALGQAVVAARRSMKG